VKKSDVIAPERDRQKNGKIGGRTEKSVRTQNHLAAG